jgi:hypothetical protein
VQSPIRVRDQSNKYKLYLLTLNPCPLSVFENEKLKIKDLQRIKKINNFLKNKIKKRHTPLSPLLYD